MVATQSWGLAPVERRSTTEHVLAELRAAIVSGRIGPSEALRETALAQLFGTGRSAIREAVRHLVQEGLVEYRLNRGSYVRELTVEDCRDVYLAREAIEVNAVRRALEDGRELGLEPLRAALERIGEAGEAAPPHAPAGAELIAADLDFHRELVRLARSPRLTHAHETLAAEAQMLLLRHPAYPMSDYEADHRVVLEALERRDPRAPELVRDHLRLSASLIAREITRLSVTEKPSDPNGEETG